MLRKFLELIQHERRALRVCEACGNPFRPGASLKGCWCFQVKLRPGAREELRGKYQFRARLSGITGDCMGATKQLTEVSLYLTAVILSRFHLL